MATTIQIEEKIKSRLEEMKIHPREPYSRVIERLIKYSGDERELSPETIRNIERALEDVKRGRTYSTGEVRKKLGIK
jgi:predicted transcriptional regulator